MKRIILTSILILNLLPLTARAQTCTSSLKTIAEYFKTSLGNDVNAETLLEDPPFDLAFGGKTLKASFATDSESKTTQKNRNIFLKVFVTNTMIVYVPIQVCKLGNSLSAQILSSKYTQKPTETSLAEWNSSGAKIINLSVTRVNNQILFSQGTDTIHKINITADKGAAR